MKREKFPKQAEIQIKYGEALERNLANVKNWKYDTELKDPEIQDAIRLLRNKVGLRTLLSVWTEAEVFELLDGDPKEYYAEYKLENIVRYIWEGSIPEVIVKNADGTTIAKDRIISYCFEVETDGYGCETGWFYFDFAVFADADYNEVAFAGTFKTAIDVLHADESELKTWMYARDWDFEKKTLEELERKCDEE